jgi:dethiobiotin synthetase
LAKRIFITATNTNIGKTHTSKLLIEAFTKLGLRVGVFKPIETGVETTPTDGNALFECAKHYNSALHSLFLEDIVPLQLSLPAAPFVAAGGREIDLQFFDRPLEKIEAHCDIVIIEGAGGLMVPIDGKNMMIDLPRYFNAATLLVSHCTLGCINDTLLSIKALEDTKLPFVWALNCREQDSSFDSVSLPYFNYRFKNVYRIDHDIDTIAKALLDTISS